MTRAARALEIACESRKQRSVPTKSALTRSLTVVVRRFASLVCRTNFFYCSGTLVTFSAPSSMKSNAERFSHELLWQKYV